MNHPEKNWTTVARSEFPWEQEALDFIHAGFPAQDNYRAWSNFEFIGDDGSINEVDLLVVSPQGVFLIEIKSHPGEFSGDARDWVVTNEGRRKTMENPVLLANRKCKRLKSLLARQKSFKKVRVPYMEPLVFLSSEDARLRLMGTAAHAVCLRDSDTRDGVLAAIKRRAAPGLKELNGPSVNRPQIKALALALADAGVRPSQHSRKVGDFELGELLFDSPLGAYQDWSASHVSLKSTKRVARIYMVERQASKEDREIVNNAARREFQLLDRLEHPGILKADPPTECEFGPVLFLKVPDGAVRLDHFLRDEGEATPVDQRIDILRQIGEIIAYAHGQKIVHRSLSPQSIMVRRDKAGRPTVQIFNWQTGTRLDSDDQSTIYTTQQSRTLHAGQLIEDNSQVYIAPEALAGNVGGGTEIDVFSLGALTYLLFSGVAPAASVVELRQKLSRSMTGGLDISEAMDGAADSLVDLVRITATGSSSDRASVDDFISGIDLIEEELTCPVEVEVNPLRASKGDQIGAGLTVIRRLGSGSVSIVYLVTDGRKETVLKLARATECNSRIKEEYETLCEVRDKVRSRIVVAPFKLLEFGGLKGFTMELAGKETMARHLREEGPLDLTYLERFGCDLVRTIKDLDDCGGIAHRDIKPDNMGLRLVDKKQYQLSLFDFSLSKASPEDIRVGTEPYMDPFIGERTVKRWDISSECFSAAMALHEMTTGSVPTWGDGKSDAASVSGEVNIQPERFDADLRDEMAAFFTKALRRNFKDRFDNPGEMLRAWEKIFEKVSEKKTSSTVHPAEETADDPVFDIPENLTPGTQLVLLALSTRLLNTLDRLSLVTVADLLAYPLGKILHLRGVGNKTRRELGSLVKELRLLLPDIESDPAKAIAAAAKVSGDTTDASAGVDLIARQVSHIGRVKDQGAEQEILQAFLGWNVHGAAGAEWPSQSELAPRIKITRQRVGQVVTQARKRWQSYPAIGALKDEIHEIVRSSGGVVGRDELVSSVLATRGSSFDEPDKQMQMASIATRAALETERALKGSRFREYRSGKKIFVALSAELKSYAIALGQEADEMAGMDPLPSPAVVVENLRAVEAPAIPDGVTEAADHRLCQLAVHASDGAALSSRMEIYPVGMPAKRAILLAQNALFGGTLTVEEIQSRVASRLPEAERLPGRPQLTKLIDSLGLGLRWEPKEAEGKGAYKIPGTDSHTLDPSKTVTARLNTRVSSVLSRSPQADDVVKAHEIEGKLQHAAKEGSYLVISVPPGEEEKAREELLNRFLVRHCNLDGAFISSMKSAATSAGADWPVVLRADASAKDSADWKNLQMLVQRCIPGILGQLRAPDETTLITHPGLLARYDRLHVLDGLASEVGRDDGIFGLWVLVPQNDQNVRPTINHEAIPLPNPAQHVVLNKAWLANKHRG